MDVLNQEKGQEGQGRKGQGDTEGTEKQEETEVTAAAFVPEPIPVVDTNNDPAEHQDEVYEAVIEGCDTDSASETAATAGGTGQEDVDFSRQVQSELRLLRELKHVLVGKASEHEERERLAMARKEGG